MKTSNHQHSKSSNEELESTTNNSSLSSIDATDNNKKNDELTMQKPKLDCQLSTKTDEDLSVNNLNLIPETSYSSSDDDDFFFDAEDQNSFTNSKSSSTTRIEQKLVKTKLGTNFNHSNSLNELQNNNCDSLNKLELKDFDACYEDDEEDELGSLEGKFFSIQ